MPMVRLYTNDEAVLTLLRDYDDTNTRLRVREVIASALSMSGNSIDPDNGIDVRVLSSDAGSDHSKYELTVDVEAMDTPERRSYHAVISRTIGLGIEALFSGLISVNVWLKLERAEYWPTDNA